MVKTMYSTFANTRTRRANLQKHFGTINQRNTGGHEPRPNESICKEALFKDKTYESIIKALNINMI